MSIVVCWFQRTLKQLEREQTDRQTDKQDDYSNPLAHARRGLITFLGIHIDTVAQTISVPTEKLAAMLQELAAMRAARTCTKRSLLSLIGKLAFAAKAILVWFPDPSTHKIRACAYYDALAKKKGLVQNYTLTRALEF